MTSRNVPVLIGFAIVNVSQLALGISLTILTARDGGKAQLLQQRKRSHTEHVSPHHDCQPKCPNWYPWMHITPAYLSGIEPWRLLVQACPSSMVRRGCLAFNQIVLTTCRRDVQIRLLRILGRHFLDSDVELVAGAYPSKNAEDRCNGFYVVFFGLIQYSICVRVDLDPWTSKCNGFIPELRQAKCYLCLFRHRSNSFQPRKSPLISTQCSHPHIPSTITRGVVV